MTPLTQTSLWANLNELFNGMDPYRFTHGNISCLFGLEMQERIITSYGGPVISASCSDEDFEDFITSLLIKIKHVLLLMYTELCYLITGARAL